MKRKKLQFAVIRETVPRRTHFEAGNMWPRADCTVYIYLSVKCLCDCLEGMIRLHDSDVVSHGNIRPSNCLVNSRWVLQVADYGLHSLRSVETPDSVDDFAYYYSQFSYMLHLNIRSRLYGGACVQCSKALVCVRLYFFDDIACSCYLSVNCKKILLSLFVSLFVCLPVCLSVSLSTLDRRRVVAPSTLTDSSQHSKHQKERALCSWWPAPPSIFADDLVVSSRCQTVLNPVVTWLWAWWAGAAWSIRMTWPKRECLE